MSLDQFSTVLNAQYSRLRQGISGQPRDYQWRISQLKALQKMLKDNDEQLCQAMWADLRKSKFECVATEQGIVLSEIEYTLTHLADWMKIEHVSTPLYNLPGHCEIHHDPLGLALIIGAWNYPINLLLTPLVGAIAGGNGAMLKPSEMAVQTAALIAKLIPQYLDQNLFAVVLGGPAETDLLLDLVFDVIFFTGSGPVGKIVMEKAAKHLTPVTLELGGKSPAVVMADADLSVAAKRITWGKFMNAGQTCVAPDYILVQPGAKEKLISEIKKTLLEFYGTDASQSPDYCRIINAKNFDRLNTQLKQAKVLHGGESKKDELYISPTLIDAKFTDEIMNDEIFGPLLPIIEMSELKEIITSIKSKPKPLSLYIFTQDDRVKEEILKQTSSGGACVNDVIMHMPVPEFPFGGVGASGMGHYHGKFSFQTFTHAKAVLKKATWLDVPVRYPPYTPQKSRWLRWLF